MLFKKEGPRLLSLGAQGLLHSGSCLSLLGIPPSDSVLPWNELSPGAQCASISTWKDATESLGQGWAAGVVLTKHVSSISGDHFWPVSHERGDWCCSPVKHGNADANLLVLFVSTIKTLLGVQPWDPCVKESYQGASLGLCLTRHSASALINFTDLGNVCYYSIT